MPCSQKSRFQIFFFTFCPKYPNFEVKTEHFRPPQPIRASSVNVFNTKEVSHWFPDVRVPKVLLHPPKKWIFGPKTAKFGPKLAFWAKYRHFLPIWSNAWPKNNADKLPKWFSVMLVPKLLLTPIKFRIFGQKRTNLAQNGHFWSNIGIFGIFGPMRDHKMMWTKCLGVFSVIWVPTILLSLVILGQAMPAYLVPWWWVGWWLWRAGCISQDTMTPIYFIYVNRGLDYYIPNTQ